MLQARHACLGAGEIPSCVKHSGYATQGAGAWILDHRGARVRDVVVRPLYGDEQSGIRLRHALMVIPLLLLRVWLRRASAALIGAPSWALLRR